MYYKVQLHIQINKHMQTQARRGDTPKCMQHINGHAKCYPIYIASHNNGRHVSYQRGVTVRIEEQRHAARPQVAFAEPKGGVG